MKNHLVSISILTLSLLAPTLGFCQSFKDYLDPKWDKYYNTNPSGIESNFSGTDFIRVIETVNFVPRLPEFKRDVNLLKRVLLSLDFPSLRQMSITGDFHSRTKKHDDYFYLYNSYYEKIEKTTWDRYAPYLIPLMDIDGLLKLD